jgi:UDP-glucose 4-epimerase
MVRILITGSGGFIGSSLADALFKCDVYGFDNFLTGRKENWPYTRTIDIADRDALYDFANDVVPEVVIHCAASYADPLKWHRDTDTNVAGGINAALIAKHHGARLIYFQTILPPVSSYAISKIASEQYQRLAGVPLTVFRLANVYGPRNLSGPVPVFYKRLTAGQPCVVVDTTRDMIFIDDVVRAVTLAVEDDIQGTFDLCTGTQTTISELFGHVASELGISETPPVIPPNPDDVQGSINPASGIPGWEATTPLAEGIAKTVASYQASGVGDTYTHLQLKG